VSSVELTGDQVPSVKVDQDASALKDDDKKGYTRQLRDWWKQYGFSQHNWAWFVIAAACDFLYSWQMGLFLIWKLFDWLPSWQKFYIEHIVSNLNWAVYGVGLWQMIVAVIDDNSWQAYVGLFLYCNFAWMFSYGEWRLGTDALRYLDNDYYADKRLYPSLLYLFGLMDHEDQPEDIKFGEDQEDDEDEDDYSDRKRKRSRKDSDDEDEDEDEEEDLDVEDLTNDDDFEFDDDEFIPAL